MANNITDNFKDFSDSTQSYVENTIKFHKLDLFKKVLKGIISGTHKLLIMFLFILGIIFLSISLAIYLGKELESLSLGYLIVGSIYMIIVILFAIFAKPGIERIILTKASRTFFDGSDDDII